MIKLFLYGMAFAIAAGSFAAAPVKGAWKEDFLVKQTTHDKKPVGWALKATKLGTPATSFTVRKNGAAGATALVVKSDKSTGGLACNPSLKVDLNKTPIIRWRWRVDKLPKGADGRKGGKDDQAVGLYLGAKDWFRSKSIAYRWETDTPTGAVGEVWYAAGAVVVKWFCLRNKKSGTGKWYVEERNVAEDFRKAFGFVPKEFALTVCGNSQYTKSNALAQVDYIEFLPVRKNVAPTTKKMAMRDIRQQLP